jgi:hypothetical protein
MTVIYQSTSVALSVIGLIALVALYAWLALALSAVFRKSGEEPWKAWVPVLNAVVLLQLGGLSGWWLLLWLVPGLGTLAVWAMVIVACHRIGRSFGYGPGMTVLAALLLPVWATVIGFGSSRWVGAEPQYSGVRRAAADEDAGLPFLAEYGRTTEAYTPIAPPPAYGPSQPDSLAQPAGGGWTPPPSTPQTAATPAAAPALPPMPPMPTVSAAAAAAATPGARGADLWEDLGLRPGEELTGEVTGAVPGAPAPISAVPGTTHEDREEPLAGPRRAISEVTGAEAAPAPQPPVTRVPPSPPAVPADEPWAPALSPMTDGDAFPDTSGEVSAIVGAPEAGAPRSARASVSAQHALPEIPDDAVEETIIARRRQTQWSLVLPTGEPIALGAEVVILGRRPASDSDYPGAQLVAIEDGTVSKTHARLVLRDDKWWVTDLDSTNGVLFSTVLGTEVEATSGVEAEAGDRFLLGDAEVRLVRSDA